MVTLGQAYEQANVYLSKRVKKVVPTLSGVQQAGYQFAKAHPEAARKIYQAGQISAGAAKRTIPKEIGKPSAEMMYSFAKGALIGVREKPIEVAVSLAIPPALKGVGIVAKGIKATRIGMRIAKIPKIGVVSQGVTKGIATGLGATWSLETHKKITAPVVTGYKEGPVIKTRKETLPDGSIKIIESRKQIPLTRNPTRNEMVERVGGVFSTELAPLAISGTALNRGMRGQFKPTEVKPKVKVYTKTITKAGKEIRRTTTKLIEEEKAEALLIKKKRKPKKLKLIEKPKPKERVIDVATHKGPIIKAKDEVIVLDLRNVKVTTKSTRQLTESLKKQELKYNEALKQETKLKSELLARQRQLAKTKVKTKQEFLQRQITKQKSKLKQVQKVKAKSLLILKSKLKEIQKTRDVIRFIEKEKKVIPIKEKIKEKEKIREKIRETKRRSIRSKIKILQKQYVKTKAVQKKKTIQKRIQKYTRQLKLLEKPKKIVVPIKLKKEEEKKKRLQTERDIKEAFIKNPVPSLKEFLK